MTAEETKTPKVSFWERMKKPVFMLVESFRKYPVTLGAIVLLALIGAILIDCGFDTEFLEKAAVFLACFAAQSLFAEECFKEKWIPRIAGYVVALPVSWFFVYVISFEGKIFLGAKTDTVEEIVCRIYATYLTALVLTAVYHMYKRQKEAFASYCLKTFFGLVRTSVVYGLFAAGLAIIIVIFNELIFDTDSFVGRVEIFLAGGIYVPAMLLVLSGKKGEVGKFAKAVVLFVLEPMLILAMAIIYIYILKIFVTGDVPSNSVFGIITSLFVSGMVIWTLACGIAEDHVMCRIARILPFVFVPCILLQFWSVCIRIVDCGYTPSRYLGVVLVLFELVYMGLYFLEWKTKKETVAFIVWAAAAFVAIVLVLPFFNLYSVCVRSQLKRLSAIEITEDLPDSKLAKIAGSTYRVLLHDLGFQGRNALDRCFTDEEEKILSSCNEYATFPEERTYYLNDRCEVTDLDISKYKKLTFVEYSGGSYGTAESGRITMTSYGTDYYVGDISAFLKDLREYGDEKAVSSESEPFGLTDYPPLKIDATHDLKLTAYSCEYKVSNGEISYLNISGYLLEK